MSRVEAAHRRPLARVALAAEAALLMGLARAGILCLPFRSLARLAGTPLAESPADVGAACARKAQAVAWAIGAASRRMPWKCNCLTQSLAAVAMLRFRGLPGTLYLGLARQAGSGKLQAHAWVRCGQPILTRGASPDDFAVVAHFAWSGTTTPGDEPGQFREG